MLAVLAVTLLFTFITPLVQDNLQESVREPVRLDIETEGGYTFWDETNQLLKVQVRRGNDDNNLQAINF